MYVLGYCLPLTKTNNFIYIQVTGDSICMTPLVRAIQCKRLDIMRLLIEHGADLEIKVRSVGTPLSVATCYNLHHDTSAVKLLLEHGADVNQRQKHGETVLFTAIAEKQRNLVELLLEHSADVNHRQDNGQTVLFTAVTCTSQQMFIYFCMYN